MKKQHIILALSTLIILAMMASCSSEPPLIQSLSASDSTLKPAESAVLRCVVEDTAGITYQWQTNIGSIEEMGDSARWTAPDFAWVNTTANVTVIASGENGEAAADTATIELTVEVYFQTLDATDDTYANSAHPSNTYGDEDFLLVGYEGSDVAYFRTFIRFLTPTIPSGETFRRARLKLYREYSPTDDLEMLLYSISNDWQGGSLNWNNQPNISPSSFTAYTDTVVDVGTFYIDVTPAVRNWISGTDNYGIMIRATDESSSAGRRDFGSKEGDASKRPVLEVVSW